ncbi:MAG: ATP-binding protein [Fibrobacteria bacterium]|nr:ATP-binding protein [Fibrobacteria bacterium]
MKRNIDEKLINWKQNKNRKVLLLRGARQVGKTYSVRKLGRRFTHFLEVNFEEDPEIISFFEHSLSPEEICNKLYAYFDIPIIDGKTLLFLDEIQACPKALKALRFFYEKKKELHVVAAGSLLEFSLGEIPSFGVGRISSLYMYPMNFLEFITAIHGNGLHSLLVEHNASKCIDSALHNKLLNSLLTYLLIGGLPDVVESYRTEKDLHNCMKILDDLLITIKDDFAKYRNKVPIRILNDTLDSIARQTGNKFKYSEIAENEPYHIIKPALNLLNMAGLAHIIYHTSSNGLPLGSGTNHKKFKVILFDTGIYQRIMGTKLKDFIPKNLSDLINRGNLVELFVGLELLSSQELFIKNQLYYWHREARSSNAEVDYVIQKGERIVPVEVKSGKKGSMQSMFKFIDEKKSEYGIRLSQENFSRYKDIRSFPAYYASLLFKDF